MGSISTLIYTSELILCFTICVLSATRHNIHMYPYLDLNEQMSLFKLSWLRGKWSAEVENLSDEFR